MTFLCHLIIKPYNVPVFKTSIDPSIYFTVITNNPSDVENKSKENKSKGQTMDIIFSN